MKNSTAACKPLILPPEMVQMLRGERGYAGESKDLSELAISLYQDGKKGRGYKALVAPAFPAWSVALMDSFLLACWEQGRKDAAGCGREIPATNHPVSFT